MIIKKQEILGFNVDYIELFWTLRNYDEILKGLDSDNSNYRNYKWFTIEKNSEIRNYQYKITFWKNDVPVFAWYLWTILNLYVETKDYFVVYGSAFNLMSLAEIIDFIHENIEVDYWSKSYIIDLNKKIEKKRDFSFILKRVDLAIDVLKPIKEVVWNFRKLKSKWSKFYDDRGNIQTYYIWEKKNTLNKNTLIRIYDKIADIKQKEKQFLYPHYLKEKYVTRIEIEFRSEMLKFLKLEQLLDKSYMFSLFTTYIWKHTNIFDRIRGEEIRLQKISKCVRLEDLYWNQIVKDRYLNTFYWYAKKLKNLWGCPVHELLLKWMAQEITLRDITNSIEKNWGLTIKGYQSAVSERYLGRLFANNLREDE